MTPSAHPPPAGADAVWVDGEGRIVTAGARAAALLRVSPGQVVGAPLREVLPWPFAEPVPPAGASWSCRLPADRGRTPLSRLAGPSDVVDPSPRWVTVTVAPLLGGSGAPSADLLVGVEDVSVARATWAERHAAVRAVRVLTGAGAAVTRAHDRATLVTGVAQLAVVEAGCDAAWVLGAPLRQARWRAATLPGGRRPRTTGPVVAALVERVEALAAATRTTTAGVVHALPLRLDDAEVAVLRPWYDGAGDPSAAEAAVTLLPVGADLLVLLGHAGVLGDASTCGALEQAAHLVDHAVTQLAARALLAETVRQRDRLLSLLWVAHEEGLLPEVDGPPVALERPPVDLPRPVGGPHAEDAAC